jgi:transposase
MGKKVERRRYTDEFKAEALVLAERVGFPAARKKLGISAQTLHGFSKQRLGGDGSGVSTPKLSEIEAENRRLRLALAEAQMERDILKKATAYFAKHAK